MWKSPCAGILRNTGQLIHQEYQAIHDLKSTRDMFFQNTIVGHLGCGLEFIIGVFG